MCAHRALYLKVVVFLLAVLHLGSVAGYAQSGMSSAVPQSVVVSPQANVPVLMTGCCYIDVPAGMASLTVHMNTTGGDLDLYARYGQDVALGGLTIGSIVADYASQSASGNETITINMPRAGRWYFATVVWTANVELTRTITATISPFSTANTLVIPQFVNGGGWSTTLFLTNVSSLSESVTVDFFRESGSPRLVPLLGPGAVSSVSTTLAPGQTVMYESSSAGSLDVGWASVTQGTTNNRITGFAIFRYRAPGAPDSEAIVDLGNTSDQNQVLLYDQSGGFNTGVALVNPGSAAVTLTVKIRDAMGAIIGTGTITLAPYSHQASFISELYPVTANKQGSVVIEGTAGFSILGLRFNPSGTFTSFPALK